MHNPLTLFIYKTFYIYQQEEQPIVPPLLSTGLKTSAQFVVDMLLREGHRAKLVEAKDQNSVQSLVTQYQPARVVLEAIWITPQKMQDLVAANPTVKWTVRVHSCIPFLANEGMAISWLGAYSKIGVQISFNSFQTARDYPVVNPCVYLPNYYPLRKPRKHTPYGHHLNVGCFGSIRPLKNQLIQALAAIIYGTGSGHELIFHMNGARIEQSGTNNLKNITALFAETGYKLKLHPWMPHEDFLELIAEMNICLQVSLTESFNIVSADAVSMGVPLVGSKAISWLPRRSQAPVDSAEGIAEAMARADSTSVAMNHEALENYLTSSVSAWLEWLR